MVMRFSILLMVRMGDYHRVWRRKPIRSAISRPVLTYMEYFSAAQHAALLRYFFNAALTLLQAMP